MAIMAILAEIAMDPHRSVLVVAHDQRLLPFAARVVHIEDGKITHEETRGASQKLREMLGKE
jgi:putative ABC transport system ATP-binding protein